MEFYKEESMNNVSDDVSNISDSSYTSDIVIRPKNYKRYSSTVVGSNIVNAVTGEKYPWLVGSWDERRFFRVTDTTRFNESSNSNCENRTSYKLFYENPHEYMKHTKIELDKDLLEKWYSNINVLYPGEYTMPY